jgi:hypothetical protein
MSATGIVRRTWDALWHHPGIFNLVFWSLAITLLVDWVLAARLVPLLPGALANPNTWTSAAAVSRAMNALSPAIGWRFGLFGLAVLLVVTPFRAAGLYGGAWEALRQASPIVPPLQFFRTAWRLFWRGLTAVVLGVLLAVVVLAIFLGLSVALSVPGVIVGLIVVLWAMVLAWVGLGALFAEPSEPAWSIVGRVLGVAFRRWWDFLKLGLLMMGLLIAASVVLELFSLIPVLGTLVAVAFIGVLTGFLAVVPSILYQTLNV